MGFNTRFEEKNLILTETNVLLERIRFTLNFYMFRSMTKKVIVLLCSALLEVLKLDFILIHELVNFLIFTFVQK